MKIDPPRTTMTESSERHRTNERREARIRQPEARDKSCRTTIWHTPAMSDRLPADDDAASCGRQELSIGERRPSPDGEHATDSIVQGF